MVLPPSPSSFIAWHVIRVNQPQAAPLRLLLLLLLRLL